MLEEKISIVTVSYNSAATIACTLDSVASQQGVDAEHVVQDGQSTDGTNDIIANYEQVTFFCEPDDGIYDGLNRGIANCTGAIIGLLHADDFYASPHTLQKISEKFAANPDLLGLYGDLKYVSPHDVEKIVRYWKAGNFMRAKLHLGWMPPHPTIFLRREVYDELGGFDTRYQISADYAFILRLFQTFGDKMDYLPETLVHMRTGGISNAGARNLLKKSTEDFWIALRAGYFAPATVLLKMLSKLQQYRHYSR